MEVINAGPIMIASCWKFERKARWREFFSDKDSEDYEVSIFPAEQKNNLPPRPPPKPLSDCLSAIRSDILGSKLSKVRNNMTRKETDAVNNLIELQKQGKIVVQPCDKTGGFACYDRDVYIAKMNEILEAKYINPHTNELSECYKKIHPEILQEHFDHIKDVIDFGLRNGQISKEDARAMIPERPAGGRCYGLSKDHKDFVGSPSLRPIISEFRVLLYT